MFLAEGDHTYTSELPNSFLVLMFIAIPKCRGRLLFTVRRPLPLDVLRQRVCHSTQSSFPDDSILCEPSPPTSDVRNIDRLVRWWRAALPMRCTRFSLWTQGALGVPWGRLARSMGQATAGFSSRNATVSSRADGTRASSARGRTHSGRAARTPEQQLRSLGKRPGTSGRA